MLAAVADTHAAIWYLFGDPRLSETANRFIERTAHRPAKIGFSAISLAEAIYLSEKGRVTAETLSILLESLRDEQAVLLQIPLHRAIVEEMRRVPREQVPDMPDRLIAATALHFGVPIISRDREIRTSNIETIW
jgi:PIN domain nuclease of toxin-antitoxin system